VGPRHASVKRASPRELRLPTLASAEYPDSDTFRLSFAMHTSAQLAWNRIATLALLREGRPKSVQSIDNLRIQKLGFRSEFKGQSRGNLPAFFKFFRYDLGPYSKELAWQVRSLEDRDFINSETRCLTWRGEYLLEYVEPDIRQFQAARRALEIIRETCEECRSIRLSSKLVDQTYEMEVPVAGMGNQIMRVRDIPMNTDIIVPPTHLPSPMLSPEMVDEISEEWEIAPSSLDPSGQEFNDAVDSAYRRVLAM